MELIIFDCFVIILLLLDRMSYRGQVTPLTIIGIAYAGLININNLFLSTVYSYDKVTGLGLLGTAYCLVIVAAVDAFWGYFYRNSHSVNSRYSVNITKYSIVTILFVIGAAAYSLQFLHLYAAYGLNIKGMNDGILGHLSSFAFILGPVSLDLAIKSKKKIKILFSLFLNLVVIAINLLFGGKYVIFIMLTYLLLYFVMKRNKKVNLKRMAKVAVPLILVAVGVFVLIYYVIPIVTGSYRPPINFAVEHMFYYLISPVVANNYAFSHAGNGDTLIPFTVVINIGKAIIGDPDYISPIQSYIFQVGDSHFTNVAGFFGEVVYDLGYIGGGLYIAAVFCMLNWLYIRYRNDNEFYISFCFFNAIVVYLFFNNFFVVSGIILPLLLAIFLDILSKFEYKGKRIL